MAQKALRKRHRAAKAVAAAAVVIAIVAAILAVGGPKSISRPIMPDTGQPLPAALSSVNLSNQTQTAETLTTAALTQTSGLQQQSALYQGDLDVHLAGAGSVLPVTAHMLLYYSRRGGNVSMAANVTGLPLIGPVELRIKNSTNGADLCSNINFTAVQYKNYLGVHESSLECSPLSKYGISIGQLEYYNATLMRQKAAQHGVYINYTSVYQSTYEGQNCTYVAGTMNQPDQNGTGVFDFCLSDGTFLPLTVYTAFTNDQLSVYSLMNQS